MICSKCLSPILSDSKVELFLEVRADTITLRVDIERRKSRAKVVILCPHCGEKVTMNFMFDALSNERYPKFKIKSIIEDPSNF